MLTGDGSGGKLHRRYKTPAAFRRRATSDLRPLRRARTKVRGVTNRALGSPCCANDWEDIDLLLNNGVAALKAGPSVLEHMPRLWGLPVVERRYDQRLRRRSRLAARRAA